MTTTDHRDHRKMPVLFHMFRDPGERYPIRTDSEEYHKHVNILKNVEQAHVKDRVYATPQLNWCDRSVEVMT